MSNTRNLKPDYLFEVSWEVCNKVGGIHTVVSTKALSLVNELKDNYIIIGPDVWKETQDNPEFIEEKYLFKSWKEHAESEGLHLKIGRWNIAGNPLVILVDFTPMFAIKDRIFTDFWMKYQLDSLSGQWDYIEPALFGYAAGRIIESFYNFTMTGREKIIAHFHEWMTGTGILYLKDNLPQIGTVFTSHATTVGRCIAANGYPLYRDLNHFDGQSIARDFGISAKYSLEKIAANQCDCFTTVSEITAKECYHFLEKQADVITPDGFDASFVPSNEIFEDKRKEAKEKIIKIAQAVTNQQVSSNAIMIAIGGRYEFRNKGFDLYIDSLGKLNKQYNLNHEVLAFILVPANQRGPRKEVLDRMLHSPQGDPITHEYLTHNLHDAEYDLILNRIKQNELFNRPEDKVKVIFIPSYLNGNDGVVNIDYYDLLIGFDATVFPSYYEPWGNTALESLAFKIPTITTTLTGFGLWLKSKFDFLMVGASIIERTDDNDEYVIAQIAETLYVYMNKTEEEKQKSREMALKLSESALWKHVINYYWDSFDFALQKVSMRSGQFKEKLQPEPISTFKIIQKNKPQWKKIFVKTEFPDSLANLQKLSRNLWWSWNFDAIELFESIDKELWHSCGYNPIALLNTLSYEQLQELENNEDFIRRLQVVYDKFANYMAKAKEKSDKSIAYFSMEYGLHDTVKIFSGGLGVLAGDYLKEASDINLNIVGVGLLYRYGYFSQTIALNGDQIENYIPQKFTLLPLEPVRDENGNWIVVSIALPGRTMYAKVWLLNVGRTPLYLMDTDIDENLDVDRSVTHQLYGGNWENRLKQELLLGVGGIRLLNALNIHPTIYHCNEGHAAFIGLERLKDLVQEKKFSFNEALEIVRSSSLFTTHTPVPAGHDSFSEDLLRTYLSHYPDRLKINWDTFMNLGRVNENNVHEKFSMSVLAVKLSQEVNGVSRIHGKVSQKMFNDLWQGYYPDELHIGYVTNGVHYQTWAAQRWQNLYKKEFGSGFLADQSNAEYWKKIHNVSDNTIWEIRHELRKELFDFVKKRMVENLTQRQESPNTIFEIMESFNEDALTIGFARRFATYKRAYLLFSNLEKLSKIVNNKSMPVQFIFAGKAHPHDDAGQQIIKRIIEISKMKEFLGKIIFIENYDMEVAKKMVQGVDVWLNTPTRPMEASGTSGEKAVMNGVVNFSVLDGWWAEGYHPKAGWALKEEQTYEKQEIQDQLDAETIYNYLEDEIIPLYYTRDDKGIPYKWISYIKNTISEIAPNFTMKRMIDDYQSKFYQKLFDRTLKMRENDYEMAKNLASWKKKLLRGWESIEVINVSVPDSSVKPLNLGDKFEAEIVLNLNELSDSDIGIEVVFGQKQMDEVHEITYVKEMEFFKKENGNVIYRCNFNLKRSGVFDFAFRMFPKNDMLPHRQDFNLIKWI